MPPRNPKRCTAYPCPNYRPCPTHDTERQRRNDRNRNPNRTASLTVYRSARWRKLRTRWLREQPWCNGPHHQHLTPGHHVDHVTPIEDGGAPYDETNLQTLCTSCHSRKTAEDIARRRARAKNSEGKGGRDREEVRTQDRRGSPAHIDGRRPDVVRGDLGSASRPTRRRRRPSP